ncbi:MAG: hypothetical protein PUK35_03960 [Methanomassiliicoccales archaeon]|uniref:hypothetical protein n=1 Tax=Candidatus Methanarcanum hacksteinii TaxID=2911857 RepID=UPI0015B13CE7|nr:hypothetical protein [Candidatus Methanomethylophilaceae archaeon]MDD7478989.1 hypothetical protein [Methanomassiliicoccales archaeon]MDO5837927.1 hypothetical protein [Methanomassiliicoccales archaeon]TQS78087.1 MAG: hypothetical protein A3204_03260 [Candidatus Methanarcanum hacksteinii]
MAMDKDNAITFIVIQLILLVVAILVVGVVALIFGLLADIDKVRDGLQYAVLLLCSMLIAGAIYLKKN